VFASLYHRPDLTNLYKLKNPHKAAAGSLR